MTLSFSAACTRIITATSACSFREPQKRTLGGTLYQPRTKRASCPVLPGWMSTVSAALFLLAAFHTLNDEELDVSMTYHIITLSFMF